MALPALMSKKLGGRRCMLRVSRADEYHNGMARAGFQGWAKLGFSAEAKILAADVFMVQDLGPSNGFPDFNNVGSSAALVFQPAAMRHRAVPVWTNPVPKGARCGPGENKASNRQLPKSSSCGASATPSCNCWSVAQIPELSRSRCDKSDASPEGDRVLATG